MLVGQCLRDPHATGPLSLSTSRLIIVPICVALCTFVCLVWNKYVPIRSVNLCILHKKHTEKIVNYSVDLTTVSLDTYLHQDNACMNECQLVDIH